MNSFIKTLLLCLLSLPIFAQKNSHSKHFSQEGSAEWRSFEHTTPKSATQLSKDKTALELASDDELQLINTQEDPLGFRHYRYQQTYKGIPVEGAIYLLHEKAGLVKHANGKLARQLNIVSTPDISEPTALQSALQKVNASRYAWQDIEHESVLKQVEKRSDATFYPEGELVIIDPTLEQGTENFRLAYKFDIYAIEPLTRQVVYVDASTGLVLTSYEKIHDCTDLPSSGTTNYSGTVNFTACEDAGTHTLKNSIGGGMQVFNSNSLNDYPQVPFTESDNFFDNDPTATEVHWATEKTYEYYLNTQNRNSLDGNGMPLYSWIHYKPNYSNAFWNGSWMTYGDGNGTIFTSFTSVDVVAHEMTHGVTDFSADLIYKAESGALNESFSDIFGEVVEAYAKPGGNDWIMGADFVVLPGKNGLRSMINPNDPNMLTQQPDTYLGDYWYTINPPCDFLNDNCGVHYNSGVQNYWFYLLSEGGNGVNDNGDPYTISGIGMTNAAAITYRNLATYLTSTSRFFDARVGAIQSAEDLFGAGSPEVFQTIAAWDAVGVDSIPPPDLNNCRVADSLALIALYNSTDGANWTTPWDINQPMDTWYGLSLNAEGCVTCLDLDGAPNCNYSCCDGNNLVGTIPVELGNLSELTYLGLNNNQLTGSIPPELGNLTSLQRLNLQTNQLTGSIPATLGNLSGLYQLRLYQNQLTGSIPSELGNMNNLIYMLLYENQLSENIPPELGNMNNLSWLMLQDNQLTGSLPPELGNLNISRLFIDNNQLSGCYDPNLSNLCSTISSAYNINQLISDGNNFDENWEDFCNNAAGVCLPCRHADSLALVALYNATDGANWTTPWDINQPIDTWPGVSLNAEGCVTCLDLDGTPDCDYSCCDGNNLIGTIPAELSNLSELTYLGLGSNQLTGSIPSELGNLTSLQSLSLQENQLTGNIPPELGNLSALYQLYLSTNQLTGNIPATLGNLDSLIHLSLSENQLSGNIPPELGNLNNLSWLLLKDNQLTGSLPPELGNLNISILFLGENQLSGCYDDNLSNLCSTILPAYNTNGYISFFNSFDENWEDFCNNAAGVCPPPFGCRYTDSLALVALYNATDGANWTPLWDLNQPIDTWSGITLNGDNCVSQIILAANGLIGNIPPEIGNLSNLTLLNLDYNDLFGSMPAELGNLSDLTILSLRNNNLSASIPAELGNLSELTNLTLGNNNLSGSIPAELGNLSNLGTLALYNNNLSGNIPPELGSLSNLTHFLLNENQLSGSLPGELGNLSNLSYFEVSYNNLSGCYDSNLMSICAIVDLDDVDNSVVSYGNNFDAEWEDFCNNGEGACTPFGCRYTDSLALVALYNTTNGANWNTAWDLTEPMNQWDGLLLNADGCVSALSLTNNQLIGIIPPEIGNMTSLERLYLENNELYGEIPNTLGNLINLQFFHLDGNQLVGNIPAELGDASSLRSIDFSNNQLSGNIPSILGNISNLFELKLANNQLSGNMPTGLGAMSNLVYLDLSDNQLTGFMLPQLGNLSNLISIELRNNQLSGCYDGNLSILCSQLSGLSNNYNISYGNNFDIPWDGFCNTGACDPVWPGDFNNDGIVNADDVLYWTVTEGIAGPLRPNATNDWTAQPAPAWQSVVNGVNIKHQDGDGNGIIDVQDLNVLISNYDSTHSNLAAQGTSPIALTLKSVSVNSDDSLFTHTFDLLVTSSLNVPVNTNGLAGTIDFSGISGIHSIEMDTIGSALQPDILLSVYDNTQNTLDFAITGTDNIDQPCNAGVARVIIVIEDLQATAPYFLINVGGGSMMSGSGLWRPVNGSSASGYFGSQGILNGLSVSTTIIHQQCNALGQATVSATGGTAPYTYEWSTGSTTAEAGNLSSGLYTVTVTDSGGLYTAIPIQINGAIPIYDANGNSLCDNDCPEFLLPTGGLPNGQYQAGNMLDSDAVIPPGNSIEFKAGQTIKLGNGFSVSGDANFSGEIENCGGN